MLYHVLFESHDAIRALSDQGQSRGRMQEVFVCRFCHSDEASEASLITPCECKGSMRYVHPECLSNWRKTSEKARDQCTLCGTKYMYSKYDLAHYPHVISLSLLILWMCVIDTRAIILEENIGQIAYWTLIQTTFLRCFLLSCVILDACWTNRVRDYINIDRIEISCKFGLLVSILGFIWPTVSRLDRLDAFHMFYEIVYSVVSRILGKPRIIRHLS